MIHNYSGRTRLLCFSLSFWERVGVRAPPQPNGCDLIERPSTLTLTLSRQRERGPTPLQG